jgi:hypothetical protein
MKKILTSFAAFALLTLSLHIVAPGAAYADDSAAQQASDASSSGSDATSSSSDEGAHASASEVFDTPASTPVDTTSPSEGSSGLSNAPTYNDNSGSGLSNAPTP